MKRALENFIKTLSEKSGYEYGFLIDRFMDMVNDGDVDLEHFVGITMEHDW